MITFTLIDKTKYQIHHENGVWLGDLLMKEDGFFDWWLPLPYGGGCWSSHILRAIADKLDEINKDWEMEIERAFSAKFN